MLGGEICSNLSERAENLLAIGIYAFAVELESASMQPMQWKTIRSLDEIPEICAGAARRGWISLDDVRRLAVFCPRMMRLTIGEAEAVFALAREGHPSCSEWNDYFADAMGYWYFATYFPDRRPAEASRELIRWLGGDYAKLDAARLRLLAKVLEVIPNHPEDLLAFARRCLVQAMAFSEAEEADAAGVA
jgi:hypothetical protein